MYVWASEKIDFMFFYLEQCFSKFRRLRAITLAIGAHADRSAVITFPLPFFSSWGGTKSLVLQPLFGLLYQPQMIGEGDCGAIGEI
jgi:hypothetical protein